jgi:CO/xanthine dehydrogenase Mo-binding subunit
VLIAVTEKFRWKEKRKTRTKNIGVGVAAGTEKGSYVAACAEVETGVNGVIVRDFHMAFECGKILNPSNLRAQVTGAIIQGLGGALTEEIEFADGKLLNGTFTKYRVPRFHDVPDITVTLLDRPDLVSVGAGETPIVAVAPAIASAFFDATGRRARQLPVGRY